MQISVAKRQSIQALSIMLKMGVSVLSVLDLPFTEEYINVNKRAVQLKSLRSPLQLCALFYFVNFVEHGGHLFADLHIGVK